jgi:hypothetical protein
MGWMDKFSALNRYIEQASLETKRITISRGGFQMALCRPMRGRSGFRSLQPVAPLLGVRVYEFCLASLECGGPVFRSARGA